MRKPSPLLWTGAICTLFSSSVNAIEIMPYPEAKPIGVSLEWYQHELDMEVLEIQANIPGINNAMLDSMAGQLTSQNNLELINLRLDYQALPWLTVYGSVGKITDQAEVNFSAVLPGVSNMNVENNGTAYSLGARTNHQFGQWLTSVNVAHSRLDLDNNSETVSVTSLVPSIGLKTDYGNISGSLVYQAVKASYSGTATVPLIGEIPVTVEAENKDAFQIMAGWQLPLANDYYINADIGLNGEKQFLLQLNKRF
ncbi:MAG: hypothetical protein ACPG51_12515 [Thiolinea sp.]